MFYCVILEILLDIEFIFFRKGECKLGENVIILLLIECQVEVFILVVEEGYYEILRGIIYEKIVIQIGVVIMIVSEYF